MRNDTTFWLLQILSTSLCNLCLWASLSAVRDEISCYCITTRNTSEIHQSPRTYRLTRAETSWDPGWVEPLKYQVCWEIGRAFSLDVNSDLLLPPPLSIFWSLARSTETYSLPSDSCIFVMITLDAIFFSTRTRNMDDTKWSFYTTTNNRSEFSPGCDNHGLPHAYPVCFNTFPLLRSLLLRLYTPYPCSSIL